MFLYQDSCIYSSDTEVESKIADNNDADNDDSDSSWSDNGGGKPPATNTNSCEETTDV